MPRQSEGMARDVGESYGPAPAASSRRSTRNGRVFSVVFVPTLACNCTCSHCFEELSGRTLGDSGWQPLFRRIRELAEALETRTLRLYWQGGEVLCMDPGSVKRGLEAAAAIFEDSGIALEHHLQTNLLLYDSAEWRDVVTAFSLGTLSSSVDLPNLYRRTPSLSPEEYNAAWLRRKEAAEADGFQVSAISLPNPETLRLGAERFYTFFAEELGVRNVQVNFPFPGRRPGLLPLDLSQLATFMRDLYEVWVARDRYLNLSPFRCLEDRLVHAKGELLCPWGYSCANSILAVGPSGEVAQCDCWLLTFRDFDFGSLMEQPVQGVLNSSQRRVFLDRPVRLMQDSECGECEFWKLCYGGCPVRAFAFKGDIFSPDHYCPVYREMFSAVLENAAVEHAAGKQSPQRGGCENG